MENGGALKGSSGMTPSGSYILVVVSQPFNAKHKELILQRMGKGLLSWDIETTRCDLSGLESVCATINENDLIDSDVLLQHSTESLGVEVLVNPSVSTLQQCVRNLLATSCTAHKHLLHAGYAFAGSGSWILQDGTFSFEDLLRIFQQVGKGKGDLHLHCAEVGLWKPSSFTREVFTKVANITFNPADRVPKVPGSEHLQECLERVLCPHTLEDMMEASPLVGHIRFNRPSLYLFPAGQGDCALFGINGFSMLIDGGFNRKPCSWDLIRHLERLDAILVTRLCENNVCGVSSLMRGKSAANNCNPKIGYVFCNLTDAETNKMLGEPKARDELLVSVVEEGHGFTQTLNELNLKPHQCWRDPSIEPFVLYHKVGHGTLEMYILSPPRDSKEMKEFLSEWNSYKETFSSTKSTIPLSHSTSICAVLIWRPSDPKETITRILFPGSAPQEKIFESLEKLKALDVLKRPVVTKASLTKKIVSKVKVSSTRKMVASPAHSVSSVASKNGDADKKEIKKISKDVSKDSNRLVKKQIVKKDVVKKDPIAKDTKKDKLDGVVKKEAAADSKKDSKDSVKKEVKKIVKKEVKAVIDKKVEVKSAPKKSENILSKTVSELKSTAPLAIKKSKTTTVAKKDIGKTPTAINKSTEVKKTSTTKTNKDISKKVPPESKAVAKTKPKPVTSTPKSTEQKAKPITVSKMTKSVAASSVVASAVAATVVAVEMKENKELQIETEPEKEIHIVEDANMHEKLGEIEIQVSPLPLECASPSVSISLSPSDTLSSAPLETVSPTPPPERDLIYNEEKGVNETKEIEPDMPSAETADDQAGSVAEQPDLNDDEENHIAIELARRQEHDDVMSSSFVGGQIFGIKQEVEEMISKTEGVSYQSSAEETIESVIQKESEVPVLETEVFATKKDAIDDKLAKISMEGSFYEQQEKDNLTNFEEETDIHEFKTDVENLLENTSDGAKEKDGPNDQYALSENKFENEPQEKDIIVPDVETELMSDKMEVKALQSTESPVEEKKDIENITEKENYEDYLKSKPIDIRLLEQARADCFSIPAQSQYAFSGDYDISQKIIHDDEMLETSVDEPEEILSKEAADAIIDQRHESESEDDVDIQQFMNSKQVSKEATTHTIENTELKLSSKLNFQEKDHDDDIQGTKSTINAGSILDDASGTKELAYGSKSPDHDIHLPSPQMEYNKTHMNEGIDHESYDKKVVESHMDDMIHGAVTKAEIHSSEKQYFDEKDRDSAEEEDEDDNSMIRHPTPPEMRKYSEEEMRDPIGPHFIKPQSMGISEQPLYEESEDNSDGSVSPVMIEEPVYGNVVKADFPEVVTLSGGTTPSEPQSPKLADSKKFGSGMEALVEHEGPDSVSNSPAYKDITSKFDLSASEIPVKSNEDTEIDENTIEESKPKTLSAPQPEKRESVSDDESCEKSETRSEKSEACEDEKSDTHGDHSDNQPDGRFDSKQGGDGLDDETYDKTYDNDERDKQNDKKQNDYDKQKCSKDEEEYRKEQYYINESSRFEFEDGYQPQVPYTPTGYVADTHAEYLGQESIEGYKFQSRFEYETEQKIELKINAVNDKDDNEITNLDISQSYDSQQDQNFDIPAKYDNEFSNKNISEVTAQKIMDVDSSFMTNIPSGYQDNEVAYDYNEEQVKNNELSQLEIEAISSSHKQALHVENLGFPTEERTMLSDKQIEEVYPAYPSEFGDQLNENQIHMSESKYDEYVTIPKYENESSEVYRKNFVDQEPEQFGITVYSNKDYDSTFTSSCSSGYKVSEESDQKMSEQEYNLQGSSDSDIPHVGTVSDDSNFQDLGSHISNPEEFSKMSEVVKTELQKSVGYETEITMVSTTEIVEEKINGMNLTQFESIMKNTRQEIVESRFQSDSPEDNIMRSDSSPEVPYNPGLTGNAGDFGNINFIAGTKKNDFDEGDSSEDEKADTIPRPVSPYAYTNRAYDREEEDIDGNRIIGKETTEFSKTTTNVSNEFDDNNSTEQLEYAHGPNSGDEFHLDQWGKPMGLPNPPDAIQKSTKKISKTDTNGQAKPSSKHSSPVKVPKGKDAGNNPVYVDLAYVPHHGDPNYCDIEFFKKIRARYYVFSGINPSKEVLNALLEAKKSWKEDLEVTIIPTYETDTLGYWMAQNEEDLAAYSIDVAASASRCTVTLQDQETKCAAYRLEF